jgi:hypothetical protein
VGRCRAARKTCSTNTASGFNACSSSQSDATIRTHGFAPSRIRSAGGRLATLADVCDVSILFSNNRGATTIPKTGSPAVYPLSGALLALQNLIDAGTGMF